VDIAKLSKEEREFVTGIINRLDSGDVKNVGAELLAEFVSALTPGYFKKAIALETFFAVETVQRRSTRLLHGRINLHCI